MTISTCTVARCCIFDLRLLLIPHLIQRYVLSQSSRHRRYPTSIKSDGSDAVHKDPDYSCVYVILKTDSTDHPEGYGLTFTLGRGNEVVAAMCESMEYMVVGKDFEKDIIKFGLVKFSKQLTQDGQMRWIGPE